LDGRRAAVITEHTVAALHASGLIDHVTERDLLPGSTAVPPGEQSKTLDIAFQLIDWLARLDLARRDVVVALGGGAR
jgi:3-dehydroquinate synthase